VVTWRSRDGGQTWNPGRPVQAGKAGTTWLSFEDVDHGWLLVRNNTSLSNPSMAIFTTSDGGMNWRKVNESTLEKQWFDDNVDLLFSGLQSGWIVIDNLGSIGLPSLLVTVD